MKGKSRQKYLLDRLAFTSHLMSIKILLRFWVQGSPSQIVGGTEYKILATFFPYIFSESESKIPLSSIFIVQTSNIASIHSKTRSILLTYSSKAYSLAIFRNIWYKKVGTNQQRLSVPWLSVNRYTFTVKNSTISGNWTRLLPVTTCTHTGLFSNVLNK